MRLNDREVLLIDQAPDLDTANAKLVVDERRTAKGIGRKRAAVHQFVIDRDAEIRRSIATDAKPLSIGIDVVFVSCNSSKFLNNPMAIGAQASVQVARAHFRAPSIPEFEVGARTKSCAPNSHGTHQRACANAHSRMLQTQLRCWRAPPATRHWEALHAADP
jgi:hypothetical protein